MASVSQLGTASFDTNTGNKSVTATPNVGDLIVIITAHTGLIGVNNVAPTDDNSSGTYTQVAAILKNGSSDTMKFWIRDNLISSGVSTIFSQTCSGDSGGGMVVLRVSGMTLAGGSAKRQSGVQGNQSNSTPGPTMAVAVLTSNPVIGAVFNEVNPAGVTPRSSPAYTEIIDTGYAAPTSGLEIMKIDSGETGTVLSWGSSVSGNWCAVVVELDASGASTTSGASFLYLMI